MGKKCLINLKCCVGGKNSIKYESKRLSSLLTYYKNYIIYVLPSIESCHKQQTFCNTMTCSKFKKWPCTFYNTKTYTKIIDWYSDFAFIWNLKYFFLRFCPHSETMQRYYKKFNHQKSNYKKVPIQKSQSGLHTGLGLLNQNWSNQGKCQEEIAYFHPFCPHL